MRRVVEVTRERGRDAVDTADSIEESAFRDRYDTAPIVPCGVPVARRPADPSERALARRW